MEKSNDINALFSLLDKKPEGQYQEIVVSEQLSESKNRWPIFELSETPVDEENTEPALVTESVSSLVEEKEELQEFTQTIEEDEKVSSQSVSNDSEPQGKQDVNLDTSERKLPLSVFNNELKVKTVANDESDNRNEQAAQTTNLETLFLKLSQKKKIEKLSVFDRLIRK